MQYLIIAHKNFLLSIVNPFRTRNSYILFAIFLLFFLIFFALLEFEGFSFLIFPISSFLLVMSSSNNLLEI